MTPTEHTERLEALRREVTCYTLRRLPDHEQDWSAGALKVDIAKSHLDESISNNQRVRTEQAFLCLEEGVRELKRALSLMGYNV